MLEQEPSRTALSAAAHRAAHQVLEDGDIFCDPLAVPILGVDAEVIRNHAEIQARRGMRFFVVSRAAIAESVIKTGVEARGVGQLVVLGAGLDTFAYRNPFGGRLSVFEVDHPATQAWKRRRLAEAGIASGDLVTYAPVDFERETLSDRLADAGLDPAIRTIFTWLGVVPYLSKATVSATLSQIAAHSGGGEVVFDYGEPPERGDPDQRARREALAARVAAAGEPFLSHFGPEEIADVLQARGFARIEDLGVPALLMRFARSAAAPSRGGGGHVVIAATA